MNSMTNNEGRLTAVVRSNNRRWTLIAIAAALVAITVMLFAASPWTAGAQEEPEDPPAKPTGLTGTAAHDSVSLTWDDPDDDSITGYEIRRRDKAVDDRGVFHTHVDDTGSSDTAYTDRDVEARGRYVYRVKARNAAGLSPESSYFNAALPALPDPPPDPDPTPTPEPEPQQQEEEEPQPPAQPTGLTGTVTHDTVSLTWDDPQDPSITGYQIRRRDRAVDGPGVFHTHVEDTGSSATAYVDTDVEAGARYVYRIRARNDAGLSNESSYFNADLPQPPAVTVFFEQATYTVAENENVAVTVVLDVDPERDLSIPIVAVNQGETQDSDYSGVPTEVPFSKGKTRHVITLTATEDTEDDDGESVLLRIGASLPDRVSAGSVDETTVSITDNTIDEFPEDELQQIILDLTEQDSTMSDSDLRYMANTLMNDEEEPFPSDVSEDRRLTLGEPRQGLIWPADDDDRFVFTAVKGQTYIISLKGAGEVPVWIPRIVGIDDPDGNRLGNTGQRGYRELVQSFLADTAGDHVIVVDAYEFWFRNSYPVGTYEIKVEVAGEDRADDYSRRTSTTGRAQTDGTPFTFQTNYRGDGEWIEVDLDKDQLYRIGRVGDYSPDGKRRVVSADWDVEIVDVKRYTDPDSETILGRVRQILEPPLNQSRSHQLSRFSPNDPAAHLINWFDPLTSGKHYLVFTDDYIYTILSDGTYEDVLPLTKRFNVTEVNANLRDALRSKSTRHSIEPGVADGTLHGFREDQDCTYYEAEFGSGTLHAEISSKTDEDWIAMDLVAGKTYLIYVQGAGTSNGTVAKTRINGFYDRNGFPTAGGWTTNDCTVWDWGNEPQATFHAAQSGRYYVAVSGIDGNEGLYRLTVIEAPDPLNPDDDTTEYDASTQTTGVLRAGGSVTSFIGAKWDRDWYKITVQAGKAYRFEMNGHDHDDYTDYLTLTKPYIEGVYDSDGVYQVGTTDGDVDGDGDASVVFVPTSDGVYFVGVRSDRPEHPWGWYTLRATEIALITESDIGDRTSTAAEIEPGDTIMSVIENLWDSDWFKIDLVSGKTYRIVMGGVAGERLAPHIESLRGSDSRQLPGTRFCKPGRGCVTAETFAFDGTSSSIGVPEGSVVVYYTATDSGAHYVATGAYNFYFDYEADQIVMLGEYMYHLSVVEIDLEDVPLPP